MKIKPLFLAIKSIFHEINWFTLRTLRAGFIALTLLFITAGYLSYTRQVQLILDQQSSQLNTIAEYKINQIIQWRSVSLTDSQIFSSNPAHQDTIIKWIVSPDNLSVKTELLTHFQMIIDIKGYQNVILATPEGKLLLSARPDLTSLDPPTQELAVQAVQANKTIFGDFFRETDSHQIFLDIAAPIVDDNQTPVAVFILRIDPQNFIYPLIQSWPTPSQSAETLLVRKEAENVLF